MKDEEIGEQVLAALSELRRLSRIAKEGSWIHRELLRFLDFAETAEDVKEENVNLN